MLSDDSQAAAEHLADELETLHAVWQQAFFTFWGDAASLRRRFILPALASLKA